MIHLDPDEQQIKNIMLDLCAVLYRHGYKTVSIGAMMRLMGVDPDRALEHDNEYFSLDDEFIKMYQSRINIEKIPESRTLH